MRSCRREQGRERRVVLGSSVPMSHPTGHEGRQGGGGGGWAQPHWRVLSRARGKANLKQILWHDAVLQEGEEKTTLVSLGIPLKSRITSLSCNFQPMFVFYNLTVLFPNVYILVQDPWWPCAQKCYPHCPSLQQTWDDPLLSHSLCLGAPWEHLPKPLFPKNYCLRNPESHRAAFGLLVCLTYVLSVWKCCI